MPDGLDPVDAAALTCAGATAHAAVRAAGIQASDHVAVFGAGGVGHLVVQYARLAGLFVSAVDIEPGRLETAREFGADRVVDARAEDPVVAIRSCGGADVAIVTADDPEAFRHALACLRRGGRLVCVVQPSGQSRDWA
ncbi:MAG TPA: zinc-binding dehydrogenase [Actinocrinis sp.]|nr:zinc-binding dehydrogenase [Actinocrinis sp.]